MNLRVYPDREIDCWKGKLSSLTTLPLLPGDTGGKFDLQ